MKKLTELNLQNALDECELIKFRSHGEWLAGMVKRLNASIMPNDGKVITSIPAIKTIVATGNSVEPEVPCKS